MPRVLLVLPTSTYRAEDFIKAATALGVEVSVASEQPLPLLPPDRQVLIDCSRPETSAQLVADLAATTPIDAIVPVDDTGVLVAALAAQHLGLSHNPPEGVAATRNKVAMRRLLEAAEVPQPSFSLIGANDDPVEIVDHLRYPLVVKPLSLSGSRGVIRVDRPEDLAKTVDRIRTIIATAGGNPNEPILAERFVPGDEVSVEGMLSSGQLTVLAIFDKPQQGDGPYFEETLFITPSRHHPEVLDEVKATTQRAVAALGLLEGPIHAELRITQGRVRVIEVAARSIGGLCGRALRFGLMGVSLEELILRHALGGANLNRLPEAAGVMMLPIPTAGYFRTVTGIEEALAVPGITEIEVTAAPGTYIDTVPESDKYLGFIYCRGQTPAQVEEALVFASGLLEFEITDV